MPTGNYVTDSERARIAKLLASTEMTLVQIAERFGLSTSAVAKVNERARIRIYRDRYNFTVAVSSLRVD